MTLYEDLQWRGLIKDVSTPKLQEILDNQKITFYWGTDPSADSLHLGHYSSLVTAKRLSNYGHHPILLIGGSTGLIGDPRPTAEREIISKEAVMKNAEGIKEQVDKIFKGKAKIVNNYDWTKNVTLLDFLRDIGKYINVNYMLDKDIIKRRLETGITYAEFSYTLLQGFDFLKLFEQENCVLQAEGSDQWGNITTGIELIKKITGKEAYGFTMPLILDKNGKKFGKSEGNALWLDINKTSAYELYQYLVNTDDELVIDYLKVFTFLTKEEIENINKEQKEHPESRIAQKELAKQIITDIHGENEYLHAKEVSECLFTGKVSNLTDQEIETVFKGVPTFSYKNIPLIELLVENKITSSKREAREFLAAHAITINGEVIEEENYLLPDKKYNIIRRGKKKYFLITKDL
ncbi:TPA: tyrosine--tRNA ligase [Candidatus Ventrenecus avicola]|nr:tyrosine--tRNA ligase [Candidatus Ventrenecus avicola]